MRKLTTNEFVRAARATHGNRYDYSQVEYSGNTNKVRILCPNHGEFLQTPKDHKKGDGCPDCAPNKKLDTAAVVRKFRERHGDLYDYSKTVYVNARTRVVVGCRVHGDFLVSPRNHYHSGSRCPGCFRRVRRTNAKFASEAQAVHGDLYDYSKVNYVNADTKVEIVCRRHGSFWQRPLSHIHGATGCPKCNLSKGEIRIAKFLESAGVSFVRQWRHPDCRNTRVLPFDFYIGSRSLLIEFDGRQHFHPVPAFGGEAALLELQRRDAIKTAWAKNNGFDLFRIKYTHHLTIEKRLREKLKV